MLTLRGDGEAGNGYICMTKQHGMEIPDSVGRKHNNLELIMHHNLHLSGVNLKDIPLSLIYFLKQNIIV